jgi:hypothetical protein
LRNNQRKSTGEILLPEEKKSSRTKNKTSSQQDTELDKVKNMNNVDKSSYILYIIAEIVQTIWS